MANLLLVVVCLLAGALMRRSGRLPDASPVVATRIVIDLALPALTLVSVHELTLVPNQWTNLGIAFGTPFVAFAVAALALGAFARVFGWTRLPLAHGGPRQYLVCRFPIGGGPVGA